MMKLSTQSALSQTINLPVVDAQRIPSMLPIGMKQVNEYCSFAASSLSNVLHQELLKYNIRQKRNTQAAINQLMCVELRGQS